jgi:hypothetical protein
MTGAGAIVGWLITPTSSLNASSKNKDARLIWQNGRAFYYIYTQHFYHLLEQLLWK